MEEKVSNYISLQFGVTNKQEIFMIFPLGIAFLLKVQKISIEL